MRVVVDRPDCRLRKEGFRRIGDLAGDCGVRRLAERQARDACDDDAQRQRSKMLRHGHTSFSVNSTETADLYPESRMIRRSAMQVSDQEGLVRRFLASALRLD